MMLSLSVTTGPHASTTLNLSPGTMILIGRKSLKVPAGLTRAAASTRVIPLILDLDKETSGVHCVVIVSQSGTGATLFDALSTNGTTYQRCVGGLIETLQAAPKEGVWIEERHGVKLVAGSSFLIGGSRIDLKATPVADVIAIIDEDEPTTTVTATAPTAATAATTAIRPFPLLMKKTIVTKRKRGEDAVAEVAVAAVKSTADGGGVGSRKKAGTTTTATAPVAAIFLAAAEASQIRIERLFDEPDVEELRHIVRAAKMMPCIGRQRSDPNLPTQDETSQDAPWASVDMLELGSCLTCHTHLDIAEALSVYRRARSAAQRGGGGGGALAPSATTVAASIRALEKGMELMSQARASLCFLLAGGDLTAAAETTTTTAAGGEGGGGGNEGGSIGEISAEKKSSLWTDAGALSQSIGDIPRMTGESQPLILPLPLPLKISPPTNANGNSADIVEIVIVDDVATAAAAAVIIDAKIDLDAHEEKQAVSDLDGLGSPELRETANELGLRVAGRRRETLAADVRFALAAAAAAEEDELSEHENDDKNQEIGIEAVAAAAVVDDEMEEGGALENDDLEGVALIIRSVSKIHQSALLGELTLEKIQSSIASAGLSIDKPKLIRVLEKLGVEVAIE